MEKTGPRGAPLATGTFLSHLLFHRTSPSRPQLSVEGKGREHTGSSPGTPGPPHPKALLAGETPVPCAVGVHGQKSRQRGSESACPGGDGALSQSHPLEWSPQPQRPELCRSKKAALGTLTAQYIRPPRGPAAARTGPGWPSRAECREPPAPPSPQHCTLEHL